jgi:hypothetical protein
MRNECLDAALRELATAGIRPTQRNDRRHIFLEWDLPNGKKRQYTVSISPSDWRSVSNTRADVRRMIREDGLDKAHAEKPLLAKALELPPSIRLGTPEARIKRVENDITGLLDLCAEQSKKIDELQSRRPVIELRINGVPMKIEPIANPEPIPPAPLVKGKKRPTPHGYLLSVMREGEWIRLRDLVARAGLKQTIVSATLVYWKKKGLVENRDRKWRKVG